MVESWGKRVSGRLALMPTMTLTSSVPGKVYEVHIKTDGVPSAEKAVLALAETLYDNFKAKVIWAEVDGTNINLQIVGSPFVWAALIAALPAILGLLGIALIAISVFTVFAAIPGWAWGLLIVGVFLIFVGPRVGEVLTQE